jgi:hypothetical protein
MLSVYSTTAQGSWLKTRCADVQRCGGVEGISASAQLRVRSPPSDAYLPFAHINRLPWMVVLYEGVSKSFRTESITKYTLTTINSHWEATQRVMEAKLARLTQKIAIQLHLVVESCTIRSSHSRRPVRKLLDTSSYFASQPASHVVHPVISNEYLGSCISLLVIFELSGNETFLEKSYIYVYIYVYSPLGFHLHSLCFSFILSHAHTYIRVRVNIYTVFHKSFPFWKGRTVVQFYICAFFNRALRHEGVLGEWRYSPTHYLTSALDGGEWSASHPGRFTARERAPCIHWIGD